MQVGQSVMLEPVVKAPSYLWDALPQWKRRIGDAKNVLLLFDFDGTVSPYERNPDDATLLPLALQSLVELAREGWQLGVITGRSLGDLRRRLLLPGLIYATEFGLEINGPDWQMIQPEAVRHGPAVQEICQFLRPALATSPEARLQEKRYSATINTPIPEDRRRALVTFLERALEKYKNQVQVVADDTDIHVLPHCQWNKGRALEAIQQHLDKKFDLTIYLGNSRMDEPAFEAAHSGLTIKVGNEMQTHAEFWIADPSESAAFLHWCVTERHD
jgi:trehalose-phosphatase